VGDSVNQSKREKIVAIGISRQHQIMAWRKISGSIKASAAKYESVGEEPTYGRQHGIIERQKIKKSATRAANV